MLTPVVILIAICIDFIFGEPQKYHPLVGFGRLASSIEKRFNTQDKSTLLQWLLGSASMLFLVLPFVYITMLLTKHLPYSWVIDVLVLYWAVGHKSLCEHIQQVRDALLNGDDELARSRVAMIVSRDSNNLDNTQIIQASVETGLENGSDAIFAPLFWYCLLGAPGVVAYRLVNTLDAMWGYRTDKFEFFGKSAARFDDVMNWIPARLVALSYALLGNAQLALKCWREQAPSLKSPNAGPVMVAGAGSLDVQLGGPTYYHGALVDKPFFGSTTKVQLNDIQRSLDLIFNTLVLWLLVIAATFFVSGILINV